MSRKFVGSVLSTLVVFLTLGCGSRTPPPAPQPPPITQPEPKAEEQPSVALKTETAEEKKSSPIAQPVVKVDPKIKAAAAKLAKKSAAGGWTIDETSAGELAQLTGPAAIETLLPLFADPAADVRRGAAFHLLGRFDPDSAALLAAFQKLLDDDDRTIRAIALQAVQKQRPQQTLAMLDRLVRIVGDKNEETAHRAAAARIIGALGPSAAQALPVISESAVSDRTPQIRNVCLSVISKIASSAEAVVVYRKTLADPEGSVRRATLSKLAALGSEAGPAAEEIAALLDDPDASTRVSAADTLVRLGAASVGALTKKLSAVNPRTREAAVFALGNLGPLAVPAISELRKCLNDSDPAVKQLTAAVLPAIEAAKE